MRQLLALLLAQGDERFRKNRPRLSCASSNRSAKLWKLALALTIPESTSIFRLEPTGI